jgi:Urocanase Rossmann-like domain
MCVALMPLPEFTAIHEQFLALSQIARERWGDSLGGRLLLRRELDTEGIAAVVAASVGGAASLCVDLDAERLRASLRAGFVDFVVANLDEALRILKNEIRRALPVSVGLTADPEPCVGAMIERGLQPDLLSALPQHGEHILVERGAVVVAADSPPDPETSLVQWSIADDPARSMPRAAVIVSASLDPARADTAARHRWLAHSPRYLGRAFASRQCLRMRAEELAGFLPRMRTDLPAVQITRDGERI